MYPNRYNGSTIIRNKLTFSAGLSLSRTGVSLLVINFIFLSL